MITKLYIDNNNVDLFKDENINVKSSIIDLQDIAKNTTEFSNSFTVPASENNNIIFKHYYNADIDNAFDARVKVNARIELGGEVFREGKISLKKVTVNKGAAYSYTINFFGQLVSIKDILGSDKLKELDFSAYDQDYEPDFIEALLTNNQTPYEIANSIPHREEFICSLLSNRKYFYASNGDAYNTDTEGNLYYSALYPSNGIYWQELKPSMLIRTIIDQIETDYGLTFTGSFFDQSIFDNMYLYLDNGSEEKTPGTVYPISVDTPSGLSFINAESVDVTVTAINKYQITISVIPESGFEQIPVILRVYNNGVLIEEIDIEYPNPIIVDLIVAGTYQITYTLEVKQTYDYKPIIDVVQYTTLPTVPTATESSTRVVSNVLTHTYEVSMSMPDITILDFIKGLAKMFKLVIVPVDETTFYINNINNYYNNGSIIDLTKYINIDKIPISRAKLLNQITYSFSDPTTIVNKEFKGSTTEAYGDEELYIYNDSGELIDGSKSEVKLPFEQVVYERLVDTETASLTKIQYGAIVDDKLKATNIKPHIHYGVLRNIDAKSICFNNSAGSITELNGYYWAPSHIMSDSDFGIGLTFGSEFDEYSKKEIEDTLYTEYYADYIASIFNIKRRDYVISANDVPLNLINGIRLNDVIKIGINYYRIDKMSTNVNTGSIKFNLFNIV